MNAPRNAVATSAFCAVLAILITLGGGALVAASADTASAVRRPDLGPGWLEITVRNTPENFPNPGDEAGPIYDFHLTISTRSGRAEVTFTGQHGSYRNGWGPVGDFSGHHDAAFSTLTNPIPAGQNATFLLQVTSIDDIFLISWATTAQNGGTIVSGTITKFPEAKRE